MLRKIIEFIISLFFKTTSTNVENIKYSAHYTYTKKKLLTETELGFYNILRHVCADYYLLQAQIPLSSVVRKQGNFKYQTELYRTIDFGIFNKDTLELLLLIELNDSTHKAIYKRRKRDISVKEICELANEKLITFWVDKPNEYEYVKNRILTELAKPNPTNTNNQ